MISAHSHKPGCSKKFCLQPTEVCADYLPQYAKKPTPLRKRDITEKAVITEYYNETAENTDIQGLSSLETI